MPSKTLRSYTDCITKKFSIESLRNGNIPSKELISWYESFKKAYTSSKFILKTLAHLEYPYLKEFEEYLLDGQDDDKNMRDLYFQCTSLGYTDTMASMKKAITSIKSKYEINSLSHKESIHICENNQDKYTLVLNKIIILKVLGYDTTELLQTLKYRENHLKFLRDMASATKSRLSCIKEIDESMKGLNKIGELSVSELVAIAKGYKHKLIIMRVYEECIKEDGKLSRIRDKLSREYFNLNKVDFFFLQRKTTELREIFDTVMCDHQIRLKKSSTYVEDRLKDIELRVVSFLEFSDKQIKENLNGTNDGDPLVFFFKNASSKQIHNLILSYGEESNYDNERVKSKNGKHHQARQRLNVAIRFMNDIAELCSSCDFIRTLKVGEYLSCIENKSELLNWNKRRVYTDDEIDKMLDVAKESEQDTLLITILREVGLRNAAICNLKFRDILDENKNPRHICRIKEKGNKIREFVTSNNLKVKIIAYARTFDDLKFDDYVFSRTLNKRMGYSTLNVVLKRIAILAGVTDVNVQAHSFRHTLVGKLMDAGNRLEVVSKFMGHSSVDTTMTYYWLKNIEELSNEINNPFMKTCDKISGNDETETEYLNKKLDACFSIIGLYREEINNAQDIDSLRKTIFEQNHKINRVLKYLVNSSIDSDSCYQQL